MKIGINPKGLSDYRRDLGFANFRETILNDTVGNQWTLFGDKDLYKNIRVNGSIVQDNLKELSAKVYDSHDPIETLFTMVENNEYKLGDCHYLMSDLTHSAGYGLAEIIVTPQVNIFARGIARANYNNQNNDRYLNSVFGFSKGVDNRYFPWFFMTPNKDEITTVREDWRYYVENHLGITNEETINRLKPPVVNHRNNLMTLHRTVEQMRKERPYLASITSSVFEVKTDDHGNKYIEKNKEIIQSLNKLLRFTIITDESQNHRNHYYNLMCFPDGTSQITTTDIVMARHGECVAIRLDQDGCICGTRLYSLDLNDDSKHRLQTNWQEGLVTGLYNAHYENNTRTEIMHHWMFHVNPHKNTPFYYDVATGSPYGYQSNDRDLGDLTTVEGDIRYFNHHTPRRSDGMVDGRLGNMKYPPMPDTPLAFAEYQETIAKLKQIPDYTGDNWYKLWFKYRLSASNADTLGYSNQVLGNGQNHGILMLDILRNYDVDIRQYTENEYNNIYDFFRTAQGHQERERVLKSRQRKDISSVWFKVGLDFSNSSTTTIPDNGSWGWMPGMISTNNRGVSFITPNLRYETALPYMGFPVDPIDQDITTRVSGDKYGFTHQPYISNYLNDNLTLLIIGGGVLQLNSLIRNILNRHVTMLKKDYITSSVSSLSSNPSRYVSIGGVMLIETEYLTAEAIVKESFCMPGFNRSRTFINRKTYGYVDLYSDISNQQVSHYRGYNSVKIADVLDFPVRLIKQHPFYARVEEGVSGVPALIESFARSPDLTNQTKLVRLWSMIDMGPITVRHVPPQMAHLKNLDEEYILPGTLPTGGDYYTSEHRIVSNNNSVNDSLIIGRDNVVVNSNSLYNYVDMFITDIGTTVAGARYYNDGDSTLAYARYSFGPEHDDQLNMNDIMSMMSTDIQMLRWNYYDEQSGSSYISDNVERPGYTPIIGGISELSRSSFNVDKHDYERGMYPELDTNWRKLLYANIQYAHPIIQSGRTYYYKYPRAGMGLLKMPYGDDDLGYPIRAQNNGPRAKLESLNEDTAHDTSVLRTTTFFVEHLYNDDEINDVSRGMYTLEDEFALLSDHHRRMGPCAQLDFQHNDNIIQIKVPMVRLASCFINGGLVPYSPHYTMHQPSTSTLQNNMIEMAGIVGDYSSYFGTDVWSPIQQQSKYEQFNEKALNNKINLGLYTLFGFNPHANDFSTRYFSRAPAHSAIAVHNNPDILYSFSHFSALRTNDPFGTLHLTRISSIASDNNSPSFLYTHNQWMFRALYHGYLRAKPQQDAKIGLYEFMQKIDHQHNARLMLLSQCKLVFDKTYWLKAVLENLPFNWIAEFDYEMFKTHIGSYRNSNGEIVKMKLDGFDDINRREDNNRHLEVAVFDPELTQPVFSNQPTLKRVVLVFIDEFGEDGLDLIYWYFTGGVSNKNLTRNQFTTAVTFSYIHEEIISICDKVKQNNTYTNEQKNRFSRIVGNENSIAKLHSDMEIFIAVLFSEMSQNQTLKDLYKEPMWFEGEFDHRIVEIPDNALPLNVCEMIHTQPWNRFLLYPAYMKEYNNEGRFKMCYADLPSECDFTRIFDTHGWRSWLYDDFNTNTTKTDKVWYKTKNGIERINATATLANMDAIGILYYDVSAKSYDDPNDKNLPDFYRIQNQQHRNIKGSKDINRNSAPIFGWWSVSMLNSGMNESRTPIKTWDGVSNFTSTHLYQAFFQKVMVDIPVDIVIREPLDAYIVNRIAYYAYKYKQRDHARIVDFSPALIELVKNEIIADVGGDISLGWRERKIYEKYNPDTIHVLLSFIERKAIPAALNKHYRNEGWLNLDLPDMRRAQVSFGPTAHIRDRVAYIKLNKPAWDDPNSFHSILQKRLTDSKIRFSIKHQTPFNSVMSVHRLDVDYFLMKYGDMFSDGPATFSHVRKYNSINHREPTLTESSGTVFVGNNKSLDGVGTWGAYRTPKSVENNEVNKYVIVNEIGRYQDGYYYNSGSQIYPYDTTRQIFRSPTLSTGNKTDFKRLLSYNTASMDDVKTLPLIYGYLYSWKRNNSESLINDFMEWHYSTGMYNSYSPLASGVVRNVEYYTEVFGGIDPRGRSPSGRFRNLRDYVNYDWAFDYYQTGHFVDNTKINHGQFIKSKHWFYGDRIYWYNRSISALSLEGVSLYDLFIVEITERMNRTSILSDVNLRKFMFSNSDEIIDNMGNVSDMPEDADSVEFAKYIHLSSDYVLGLWNLAKQRLVANAFRGMGVKPRRELNRTLYTNDLFYDFVRNDNENVKHPYAEMFEVVQRKYTASEWALRPNMLLRCNIDGYVYGLNVGHVGGMRQMGSSVVVSNKSHPSIHIGQVRHYICSTLYHNGDVNYDNSIYYSRALYHTEIGYSKYALGYSPTYDGKNIQKYMDGVSDRYVWELKNRNYLDEYCSTYRQRTRKILLDCEVFISNNQDIKNVTTVDINKVPYFMLATYAKLLSVYIDVPARYQMDNDPTIIPICHMTEQAFHPYLYPLGATTKAWSFGNSGDTVGYDLIPNDGLGNTGVDNEGWFMDQVVYTKLQYITIIDLAGGFNYLLYRHRYSSNKPMVPYANTSYFPSPHEANWYDFRDESSNNCLTYAVVPSYISDAYMSYYNTWGRSHGYTGIYGKYSEGLRSEAPKTVDTPEYPHHVAHTLISTLDVDIYGTEDDNHREYIGTFRPVPKTMVVGQYPRISLRQLYYDEHYRAGHAYTDPITAKHAHDPIVSPWTYNLTQLYSLPDVAVGCMLIWLDNVRQ